MRLFKHGLFHLGHRHNDHHPNDPHHSHGHMYGHGETVHFAFKQVSLFHGDKHVHVLLWVDGRPVNQAGHGMGEACMQLSAGQHTVGLAAYNPDTIFDDRHPYQPEDTARFTLKERSRWFFGLFGGHSERHVIIEYGVKENLLTKAAKADIRRIKVLK